MSKETLSPEDYEKLKIFLGLHVDWFFPKMDVKPEDHPLVFLANLEKKSLANAKRGLQMAINDIVECTADWRPEQVAEADAKFAANGTFPLSEIRRRYSKKYQAVLKSGVIRSETEYYLLKGIIDGSSIEADATEIRQIEALLAAFESKAMQLIESKGESNQNRGQGRKRSRGPS